MFSYQSKTQVKIAHRYTFRLTGYELKDLHLSTDQLAREQRAYKAFFSIMKSPPISCHKGYNR